MRLGVARKVDKLSTVRIGSARYSVPHLLRGKHVDVTTVDDRVQVWHQGELIAEHRLVPPGSSSILDEHYDKPTRKPARAVRPRTKAEQEFVALGEDAVTFLRAAAAKLAADPDFEARVAVLPPEAAREALMMLPGVGPKVADCVRLFGLGQLDAFPVDTWIRKVMDAWGAYGDKMMYGKKTKGVIRSTVWIGRDGTVRKHWKRVSDAAKHPEQVWDAVRGGEP